MTNTAAPLTLVDLVTQAQAAMTRLSQWIDDAPANAARNPEALTWSRLAKVAEECGEVIAAYIGFTGQNPRKGVTHTGQDVESELLDVALTALLAYEHVTNHRGDCVVDLLLNVLEKRKRAIDEFPHTGKDTND